MPEKAPKGAERNLWIQGTKELDILEETRRLIDDFCALMEGEQPSVSCTSIDDSVWGHFACYAADASQETKEIVTIGSGK